MNWKLVSYLVVAFVIGVAAAPHLLPPRYSIKTVPASDEQVDALGAQGYHVVGTAVRGLELVMEKRTR